MVNYSFKSYVIGLYDMLFDCYVIDLVNRINLYTYQIENENSKCEFSYWTINNIHIYILETYGKDILKEVNRVNHAHYERLRRLRPRVSKIIYTGIAKFLTFTFTDIYLDSTIGKTRRKYVSRFLNTLNSIDYVANIDFGDLYGREHYHCIIACDDFDLTSWKYGSLNCERVVCCDFDDDIRISKYISKLSNHAIKSTTKRNSLLYKRSPK